MSGKLTTMQRLWRALFPKPRAKIKPKPGICCECQKSFIGNPRQLTCGAKACKKARRNRILSERYKPVKASSETQVTTTNITGIPPRDTI